MNFEELCSSRLMVDFSGRHHAKQTNKSNRAGETTPVKKKADILVSGLSGGVVMCKNSVVYV